jgi:hypothetical protein
MIKQSFTPFPSTSSGNGVNDYNRNLVSASWAWFKNRGMDPVEEGKNSKLAKCVQTTSTGLWELAGRSFSLSIFFV